MKAIKSSIDNIFSLNKKPSADELLGIINTIDEISKKGGDNSIADQFVDKLKNVTFYYKDAEASVKEYFSGVHVFIFHYQGTLHPHLRSRIDNFAKFECAHFVTPSKNSLATGPVHCPVPYTEFKTNNVYFADIENAVLLKDFYGEQIIHGMSETRDYIALLHSKFYQKNMIIPKMQIIKKQ